MADSPQTVIVGKFFVLARKAAGQVLKTHHFDPLTRNTIDSIPEQLIASKKMPTSMIFRCLMKS
jgi:hypothetical protein